MAGEWRTVSLSDVCREVRYGYTASASEQPTGTRFLRVTDITTGVVDWKNVPFCEINEQDFARYRLEPGDIVIARMGTIGVSALIREPAKAVAASYLIRHRVRESIALPQFIAYVLRSPEYWDFVWSHGGGGAVQPNINAKTLGEFRFHLPPLAEQRAIAHILGTLDDKIELLRRQNETLEAMARALFKAWFVDFEPVRAKMEGRWRRGESLPGLPAHLYDLFPDRLVESELGEIPEGWRIGVIEDLCESITSGGTPTRKNPSFWNGGTIPWFKTGELLDGPLIESEEHITEAALTGSSCKLWPAGTILFALYASPTVGRLGVLTHPGTSNQAAAGLIAKKEVGTPFLRRLLLEERAKLQAIAVGAAQQNINLGILKSHQIIIPGSDLASIYSKLMSCLDEQQAWASKEIKILAALRDTLLPKLISGELRVKDAEAFLKERGL